MENKNLYYSLYEDVKELEKNLNNAVTTILSLKLQEEKLIGIINHMSNKKKNKNTIATLNMEAIKLNKSRNKGVEELKKFKEMLDNEYEKIDKSKQDNNERLKDKNAKEKIDLLFKNAFFELGL